MNFQNIETQKYLNIRECVQLSMTSKLLQSMWFKSSLYNWLIELFKIEFDSNGCFLVYSSDFDLTSRVNHRYQNDYMHHWPGCGTKFMITRKNLMMNHNIFLAFDCNELHWFHDPVWRRHIIICSRDDDLYFSEYGMSQKRFVNFVKQIDSTSKVLIV